jgi:hypothetical protein
MRSFKFVEATIAKAKWSNAPVPVSMSLALRNAHAPVVALRIDRPDVGGQAPAVVSLIIEVPTIIETFETTRRRHIDLNLVDRKPRVLSAVGRIGSIRSAGNDAKGARHRQDGQTGKADFLETGSHERFPLGGYNRCNFTLSL